MRKGFQRVKIDGEFHDIEDAPALDKKLKHDIDVVVDRIVVAPDISGALAESFETALKLADGIALAEFAEARRKAAEPRRITFSEKFACPVSGFHYRRDRAAAVLVQQSVRRLPGLRWPGYRAVEDRPEPDRVGRDSCRCAMAPSCRGARPPRPTTCRRCRR